MTKYPLAIIAVVCAFAITTKSNTRTLHDYYFTYDNENWIGASSVSDAKGQTADCDENLDEFCANVYSIDRLEMDGETVLGVAEQPGGGEYLPNAVLEYP